MKSLVFSQYAIVKANTAALFTTKLNEEIYKLKDKEPNVTFSKADPLVAYVEYSETEQKPETLEEVAVMDGIHFVCEQCPHFHAILKADETEDMRVKYGDCDFEGNEFGRTLKSAPACPHLFELIREGGVKLCFK